MLLERQTDVVEKRTTPTRSLTLATCWATAVGKCTRYAGCKNECPFYYPASPGFEIEMTVADFQVAPGGGQ